MALALFFFEYVINYIVLDFDFFTGSVCVAGL